MQIEFFTTKDNFLELFEWVKANICDLVVLDPDTKGELDESELYQAEIGYWKKIYFTTGEFVPNIKSFSFPELQKYCVALVFGYSPDTVYTMDYTDFNLQKNKTGNMWSRLYRGSFYSSDEETKVLKSIYNKIAGKIRRNSTYVANRFHLLRFE